LEAKLVEMLVRLSSKGQLVIPKSVRQELGLEPGDRFHLEVKEGRLVLEPVVPSAIDQLYARYAGSDLLADLEREHREELDHERSRRS
jgi:AbrB family looped-hinge helix DNA binding protein